MSSHDDSEKNELQNPSSSRRHDMVSVPVWLWDLYADAYYRLKYGIDGRDLPAVPPTPPLQTADTGTVPDAVLYEIRSQLPKGAIPRGILAPRPKKDDSSKVESAA